MADYRYTHTTVCAHSPRRWEDGRRAFRLEAKLNHIPNEVSACIFWLCVVHDEFTLTLFSTQSFVHHGVYHGVTRITLV